MDKHKKEDINSNFIKKYPIIFKKYRPIRRLSSGVFSEIYSGINIHNNEKVAIKIEKRNIKDKYLESECYTLFSLRNIGIPKVLSFGHNKEYDILVMPLLGKSLLDIFKSKNLNYEFKDICLIAIQIMDRIQWVHSRKIIHRDIKPDNFLIGLNDPHILYLIDFGLSKKFQSTKTGKHIKISELKKFTGSIIFASSNSLKLLEQSRRDDLESIGYMLIYLMKGSLPWQKIKVDNKKASYFKIGQLKNSLTPEKLCQDLPKEFAEYLRYVKNLKFEEIPNYEYLRNLFVQMMSNQGFEEGKCFFSWVNLNNMNIRYITREINLSKRSCSRKRVINKIRKTLENSRKSCSENKNDDCLSQSYNFNKDNLNENFNKFKNIKNQENKKYINQKKFNLFSDLNIISKSCIQQNNPEINYNKINNKTNIIYNPNNILNFSCNQIFTSPLAYKCQDKKNKNFIFSEKNVNNNINRINNNYYYNNLKNALNSQENIYNNNYIKINPYKNRTTSIKNNNNNYHKRVSSIYDLNREEDILINSQLINNSLNNNNNKSSNYIKKNNIIFINNNIFPNNSLYYNKTIEKNNQNYIIKQKNNLLNNIKIPKNKKIYNRNARKFKLFNIFNSTGKKQNITSPNNININQDNNDLIKEINMFNKRYNNENILRHEHGINKIKIHKISQLTRSPINQKELNKIIKKKYKSPNNANCGIF